MHVIRCFLRCYVRVAPVNTGAYEYCCLRNIVDLLLNACVDVGSLPGAAVRIAASSTVVDGFHKP